ncbi:MAG: EAL domain-containing protein [Gammaproteobacteria bacterium]|nr:EAL domain-containing protein [Gammaproteobacteria bacterium]
MKLGARTAVWALALSSIPLLGMALLAFHTARSTLRAEIDHQLLAAARAELATVERFVGDAQTDLSTWSNLHIIQDVLNDDPDGEASRELARLAHQASSFTELLALNAAGKVVAATRGDYIGLELGDSIAHRQALSGRGYRSPVERSALIDQEAMTLAAPIRANQARDQVLGTLVGIIDWHEVSATLDELTVLGARQDRDRRLLLRDPARGAALYDTIGADPAAYAALPTEPGLTESTFDGRAYLIGTAVAPTDGDAPPWRVHTLVSTATADAAVLDLRDRFIAFGVVFLIASTAAGLAFSRSLERPIAALERAASRLAERDFDTPLPAPRSDEIGSLTASFAALRSALKANEAQRSEAEQKIRRLAYFDSTTGLPNRAYLEEHLHGALAAARRHGKLLAVLYFDLDHFKRINDTLGHGAGDLLLKHSAERLRQCLRASDLILREGESGEADAEHAPAVVRFGGDEFILVLGDLDDAYSAARVARRLQESFVQPFKIGSDELFVTASIGIALYPDDGQDAESLLRNADAALFDAKQHGRNGYSFYLKEMNARSRERLSLEGRLRRAIEQAQFELHYQPQICLETNRMIGLEALVRWRDPEKGLVSPMEFIPLAEETGLIVPLGEWILARACAQMKSWRGTALDGLRVAINLSLRQVKERDFAERVAAALDANGLAPGQLELELTESVLMEDSDGSGRILESLKAMGLTLSIDDFGTGYSSLSYLKRFAIDSLKIDRSFVRDIESDPNDQAIITAIIAMAHKLNLEVVAEGVETRAQAALLRQFGCDHIQGYWISRPLPANEIERFASQPIAALESLPLPGQAPQLTVLAHDGTRLAGA